ncbi:MAG: hypothetical protein QOE28_1032, partial [Solirubrobacteraceae bacterium]|nr:hypothetical protein [Solirubrobacteraceae bacterium]
MPRRQLTPRGRLRLAVLGLSVLFATIGILGIASLGDPSPAPVPTVAPPPGPAGAHAEALPDPFAWDPARAADFERAAAAGTSHGLYRLTPGGAQAGAARTARWRGPIEQAAKAAGVDPDTLEGLVYLESSGRDDAETPQGVDGAVGLTQILPGTATDLLHMHVDLAASARYGRRIARTDGRRQPARLAALRRARARVDERFDATKSLAATAAYLKLARSTFGREDLAFVSYHMGIGNLQSVVHAYTGHSGKAADLVSQDGLSWPEMYFDSSPVRHPAAYAKLLTFGDESANYLWKIGAAKEIMRLWRTNRPALDALVALHGAKASAEEVLHPDGSVPRFADPGQLHAAWNHGDIVALPDRPDVTGLKRDSSMGQLAGQIGQPEGLYRGLRPEALALALYLGAQVRAMSGT